MGVRKAAKFYKVPYSTLQCIISGKRRAKSHTGGRPSALNEQEEKKLVECLRILTQWGFGLSRTELLNCIEQFVTENDIKTPSENNRPGEDWFLNFKKRHGLSIKKNSL